ncbi:MAG: hypothetical protein H7A21_00635 [Spirochaetales bacterium]|nr:hypothetical protein [Leptospiraceae bacterium]MCP5479916.1 hypothetical protein [Spirochaetales bacterium]MCP5486649.1 hypothetical protein [Spirochaetales bacterium]
MKRFLLLVLLSGLPGCASTGDQDVLPPQTTQSEQQQLVQEETGESEQVAVVTEPEIVRPEPTPEPVVEPEPEPLPEPFRPPNTRDSFWISRQQALVGDELQIHVPSTHRAILFRNDNALQFHGSYAFSSRLSPALSRPFLTAPDMEDLTELLLDSRGNYVVLLVPEAYSNRARTEIQNRYVPYILATTQIGERTYAIINIESDGDELLRVELEAPAGSDRPGDYLTTYVEEIYLDQ